MPDPRLAFALEQIGPGDWQVFEHFAAEFLVIRFPNLRTTASPHGDRGRDGQLYVVDSKVRTALQYSVAQDWRSKIRGTVARLGDTLPSVRELVYATSQIIGPDADELKTELWEDREIILDVCDRNWFVDREATAPQRIIASEELIALKVKPFLRARGLTAASAAVSLDPSEERLALLHLSLDASDTASSKGLTKESFESLVLAALHGSNVERAVSRQEIVGRVRSMLPAGSGQQVTDLVNSALSRLSDKAGPVNHLNRTDKFHLSFAEEARLDAQAQHFLADERDLEKQLMAELRLASDREIEETDAESATALRGALESILLLKGELFASAARTGEVIPVSAEEIISVVSKRHLPLDLTAVEVAAAAAAVLERPRDGVRAHLRRLADAYTMFAFLRQTPDVQKVVTKIFADGEIWIDTSIVLPLIAETLIGDVLRRPFTITLKAAREAGMQLFVTDGVIEEVERHLNRSLAFASMNISRWNGRVPFVYSAYADSGRSRADFASWIEEFRGKVRPEDDVRDSLRALFGIERRNLLELSDNAPIAIRSAIQEVWAEVHDRRRARGREDWDQGTIYRLIAHDVENCVGVLESRLRDRDSAMGYRHWWLTLDGAAFRLSRKLRDQLGLDAPLSPALSPDYLVQVLRIGPMRTAVESDLRVNLPMLIDFSRLDRTPRSLIASADRLRNDMEGRGEHVIRRRVRDEMDRRRAAYGTQAFEAAMQNLREGGDEQDDSARAAP